MQKSPLSFTFLYQSTGTTQPPPAQPHTPRPPSLSSALGAQFIYLFVLFFLHSFRPTMPGKTLSLSRTPTPYPENESKGSFFDRLFRSSSTSGAATRRHIPASELPATTPVNVEESADIHPEASSAAGASASSTFPRSAARKRNPLLKFQHAASLPRLQRTPTPYPEQANARKRKLSLSSLFGGRSDGGSEVVASSSASASSGSSGSTTRRKLALSRTPTPYPETDNSERYWWGGKKPKKLNPCADGQRPAIVILRREPLHRAPSVPSVDDDDVPEAPATADADIAAAPAVPTTEAAVAVVTPQQPADASSASLPRPRAIQFPGQEQQQQQVQEPPLDATATADLTIAPSASTGSLTRRITIVEPDLTGVSRKPARRYYDSAADVKGAAAMTEPTSDVAGDYSLQIQAPNNDHLERAILPVLTAGAMSLLLSMVRPSEIGPTVTNSLLHMEPSATSWRAFPSGDDQRPRSTDLDMQQSPAALLFAGGSDNISLMRNSRNTPPPSRPRTPENEESAIVAAFRGTPSPLGGPRSKKERKPIPPLFRDKTVAAPAMLPAPTAAVAIPGTEVGTRVGPMHPPRRELDSLILALPLKPRPLSSASSLQSTAAAAQSAAELVAGPMHAALHPIPGVCVAGVDASTCAEYVALMASLDEIELPPPGQPRCLPGCCGHSECITNNDSTENPPLLATANMFASPSFLTRDPFPASAVAGTTISRPESALGTSLTRVSSRASSVPETFDSGTRSGPMTPCSPTSPTSPMTAGPMSRSNSSSSATAAARIPARLDLSRNRNKATPEPILVRPLTAQSSKSKDSVRENMVLTMPTASRRPSASLSLLSSRPEMPLADPDALTLPHVLACVVPTGLFVFHVSVAEWRATWKQVVKETPFDEVLEVGYRIPAGTHGVKEIVHVPEAVALVMAANPAVWQGYGFSWNMSALQLQLARRRRCRGAAAQGRARAAAATAKSRSLSSKGSAFWRRTFPRKEGSLKHNQRDLGPSDSAARITDEDADDDKNPAHTMARRLSQVFLHPVNTLHEHMHSRKRTPSNSTLASPFADISAPSLVVAPSLSALAPPRRAASDLAFDLFQRQSRSTGSAASSTMSIDGRAAIPTFSSTLVLGSSAPSAALSPSSSPIASIKDGKRTLGRKISRRLTKTTLGRKLSKAFKKSPRGSPTLGCAASAAASGRPSPMLPGNSDLSQALDAWLQMRNLTDPVGVAAGPAVGPTGPVTTPNATAPVNAIEPPSRTPSRASSSGRQLRGSSHGLATQISTTPPPPALRGAKVKRSHTSHTSRSDDSHRSTDSGSAAESRRQAAMPIWRGHRRDTSSHSSTSAAAAAARGTSGTRSDSSAGRSLHRRPLRSAVPVPGQQQPMSRSTTMSGMDMSSSESSGADSDMDSDLAVGCTVGPPRRSVSAASGDAHAHRRHRRHRRSSFLDGFSLPDVVNSSKATKKSKSGAATTGLASDTTAGGRLMHSISQSTLGSVRSITKALSRGTRSSSRRVKRQHRRRRPRLNAATHAAPYGMIAMRRDVELQEDINVWTIHVTVTPALCQV
ncbi:hypothetical protein BC828DRAFT_384682 [Blastocladiella britannica]|nr:hypothetical protein BC828DRAFT_384682 [Blastocladiella britannica]